MKRFWLGREVGNTEPGINEMTLDKDPFETYREAADRAEEILETRSGRLYVLEAISCVQSATTKWTHLDE